MFVVVATVALFSIDVVVVIVVIFRCLRFGLFICAFHTIVLNSESVNFHLHEIWSDAVWLQYRETQEKDA